MTQEDIAKVCHAANLQYRANIGEAEMPAWSHAPQWQRESLLHGVHMHMAELIKSGGETGVEPSASHESWYLEKLADGWTYGPRDDAEKTHPCMVEFDQLPPIQQRKDFLFAAIVKALFPLKSLW